MILMMIRREEDAICSIQNEHLHSTAKTVCMHGTAQQVLKENIGNSINYDYESIHYIDQRK